MRTSKHYLFFLLTFILTKSLAQEELPPPMVLGKIPSAELQLTRYEPDTTTNAVVLCNYATAMVENPPGSIRLRWEHQKRIKILKKQGFSYANIEIPFYHHNNKEEFFFDKAMVHLPNGQSHKLTKKDIFIEKLNDYYSMAKFTFPKLEEGCIVEYSYFINSELVSELREWYFQEDIPVIWSEIRVGYPEFLRYVYLFQGVEGMTKTEEKPDGTVRYEGLNGSFLFTPSRFVMQNAVAMKEEAFVTTMKDYLARIQFQLSEVTHGDGRLEKVMVDWPGLQEEIKFLPTLGEQLLKKGNYKKIVDEVLPLASKFSTNKEKVQFFYDYISQNMSWNGGFSIFTRRMPLEEIFASRKANSGEINMMLYVLLREAGITAFPVLTSTRSNGRMFEQYPILDQFDHLLVLVVADGDRQLLDATDPLRPLGYPSPHALNGRGLMLNFNKNEPSWMDINPATDGADILVFDLKLDEAGTLSGKMTGAHKGYNAIAERRGFIESEKGLHWKNRLEKRYPDIEITSAKPGNLKELGKTFMDTLELNIPNAAQVVGDLIYLNPTVFSEFDENIFKLNQRTYPVDIPYHFTEQLLTKIALPKGYKLEGLPDKVNRKLPGGGCTFFFAVEANQEGILQISSKFSISKLKFMPNEYPSLKELFDIMVAKYQEQIVLKKME